MLRNIDKITIRIISEFTKLPNEIKTKLILINTISKINIKKVYWLILPDCKKLTCLLRFKPDLANPEGPKTSIKPLSINLYVVS